MMGRDPRPSPKELASLCAVARQGTIHLAAAKLDLSPHTVDTHLDRLRRKTGLRHLPQLIAWAADNGWLFSDAKRSDGLSEAA